MRCRSAAAAAGLLSIAALLLVLRRRRSLSRCAAASGAAASQEACSSSGQPQPAAAPPPKSVRNAEKDRTSTCLFADRVACCAIEAFERLSSAAGLAYRQTVVAAVVCVDRREDDSEPTFLAVSLGSGTKFLRAAQIRSDEAGARVRDCHAEVLARRGFQRYLCAQLAACLRGEASVLLPPEQAGGRFALAPGVSFHLYSSSQPCGNASAKRWAKPTCGPQHVNHGHGYAESSNIDA